VTEHWLVGLEDEHVLVRIVVVQLRDLRQIVAGDHGVEEGFRRALVDRKHVVDPGDAADVATAQEDFLLAGLISGDTENGRRPTATVKGHGQPGYRQALRVDVSLNGIASDTVHLVQFGFGRIVVGRIGHRIRRDLCILGAKKLLACFLDEIEKAHADSSG
jgi:hypothetical protein